MPWRAGTTEVGDEHRDHGHEEQLAEQCLEADDDAPDVVRGGEVAEAQRRDHDEAEVEELHAGRRAGLEEVRIDAVERAVDRGERDPEQQVGVDRAEDRLDVDDRDGGRSAPARCPGDATIIRTKK